MLVVLLPIGLMAQGAPAGGEMAVYGSAVATPLMFQNEVRPTNEMSFRLGISALDDDNVLGSNNARITDEALSINSQLDVSRKTPNVMIDFNYQPFYLLYRQYDQLDRLNHAGTLNMKFRLGSHILLGLHDALSYQNGVYPALTGQQNVAGAPLPSALNTFLYSPTLRSLSNTPGLDLTFVKSSRTSLTLSGNFLQRKFSAQAGAGQPLYNDTGLSGGLQYQYRMTIHTTFGLLLQYQDSTYEGLGGLLIRQRSQVASTIVSVDSRLSPTVSVSVFGGPQYLKTLGQTLSGNIAPGRVAGSGGGSITKEVRSTAVNLAVQRAITDGGGIFTSVVNTNVSFGIRRRLVGRWQASWNGSLAAEDATLLQLGNGKADTASSGVDFTRPLGREGTNFRISYSTIHQITKGNLPSLLNFDRNQVTIAFEYQLKAIPFGR